ENGTALLPGGQRLSLPSLPQTGSLRLGIRPEDLALSSEGEGSFAVELRSVEHLGADAFGYGVLLGTDQLITLRLAGATTAKRGDVLHVTPRAEAVHVFSVETGKRVA